jgi:hypothetical protein
MRRKSERQEQDSNSPLNPFYLSINNMSKEWKWNSLSVCVEGMRAHDEMIFLKAFQLGVLVIADCLD